MLTRKERSPRCALNPAAGLKTWPLSCLIQASAPVISCIPRVRRTVPPACGTAPPLCSALWHKAANQKRQPRRIALVPQEVINNYWLNKVK